jgi:hypothetical protein
MKNLIVKSGTTLTGALNDGVIKIAGVFGGDVELDYNGIKKADLAAYSAGTAQVSTVTYASSLTAGDKVSFQLVQDLGDKNDALTDVYTQVIEHTITATDTVTTIATSIKDQVNDLPFEIVATSTAGEVTLTATAPYTIFNIAEVKDDGGNQAIATTTTGVAPAGITGTDLVAMGVEGAVSGSNYDILELIYEDPRPGDSIIANGTQVITLYIDSGVSTADLENSLKALDIADVSANAISDINGALAQIRKYLAKLS